MEVVGRRDAIAMKTNLFYLSTESRSYGARENCNCLRVFVME